MARRDYETSLGELRKTNCGRWALNEIELSSGSHFEVMIQGHWIRVVIEYDGKQYQVFPRSVKLYRGLRARFIGEYAD